MIRWAVSLCAVTGLLAADNAPISKTEHFDLAANGLIRLVNSTGSVTIQGWDSPGVEITTIKSAKNSRAALDQVRVITESKDGELVVRTEFPKHKLVEQPFRGVVDFNLEYRIKAPRTARLIIDHDRGEVYIDGISGEIQANNKVGDIALHIPDGSYAIEARSKIGAVTSDFPGTERRQHWFGHEFQGAPAATRLRLRIGYGDIIIVKIRRPELIR